MPLPTTRVIHPRWSEHHRPTATGTQTAECIITSRTGTGTTAPDGAYTPAAATTIYTGVCRLNALPRIEPPRAVGGAQETHHRYRVAITYDAADIPIGASVHITMATDARLIGREFRVTSVAYGSEQWERVLTCDEREA